MKFVKREKKILPQLYFKNSFKFLYNIYSLVSLI